MERFLPCDDEPPIFVFAPFYVDTVDHTGFKFSIEFLRVEDQHLLEPGPFEHLLDLARRNVLGFRLDRRPDVAALGDAIILPGRQVQILGNFNEGVEETDFAFAAVS